MVKVYRGRQGNFGKKPKDGDYLYDIFFNGSDEQTLILLNDDCQIKAIRKNTENRQRFCRSAFTISLALIGMNIVTFDAVSKI